MSAYRQLPTRAMPSPVTFWLPWSWPAVMVLGLTASVWLILLFRSARVELRCSHVEGACIVTEKMLFNRLQSTRYPLSTLIRAEITESRSGPTIDDSGSSTYGVRISTTQGPIPFSWSDDELAEKLTFVQNLNTFIHSGQPDSVVATYGDFDLCWWLGAGTLGLGFLLLIARSRIVIEPEANRLTVHRWRWVGSRPRAIQLDTIEDVSVYRVSADPKEAHPWALFVRTREGYKHTMPTWDATQASELAAKVRGVLDAVRRARRTNR